MTYIAATNKDAQDIASVFYENSQERLTKFEQKLCHGLAQQILNNHINDNNLADIFPDAPDFGPGYWKKTTNYIKAECSLWNKETSSWSHFAFVPDGLNEEINRKIDAFTGDRDATIEFLDMINTAGYKIVQKSC